MPSGAIIFRDNSPKYFWDYIPKILICQEGDIRQQRVSDQDMLGRLLTYLGVRGKTARFQKMLEHHPLKPDGYTASNP